ncbi:LOW QUALITY PROTEIN: uncharacterized protein [Bemisia tabaci]
MSNSNSLFFDAVENNDLTTVKNMIQNKMVDVNSFNSFGKTSLHISVEKGFIELTKELIDAKSDINALASDETTPFSIAAENGNSILIELLLGQSNLDVSRSYHEKTTLHIACEKGHTDVVKALLADHRCTHYVNMKDSSGKTPTHIAVEYGRTNILSNLLAKTHDVNAVDKNGCTPLWIAIENNQEKCAQILLKDERVDVKTRHFSQTPLERALKEKNTNISKLIIDRVGGIEITDEDGLNPLHRAVDAGMVDVVDYVIKKGANIQSKTKNGNTPLHVAARSGHLEVAKFLVDNGADIHARSENYYNCTPLQLAVICSKLEVAKFLISVGSDINAHFPRAHYAMDRGGTLLHWASREMDEEEIIRFLVENGADVNATEYDGRTPLCLLVKHHGSFAVMRYLIEKGATLNNERGGTPLYWAFSVDYGGHDPKVADFLIEMGTDVNSCIDYHGDEWDQMRTALHLARHLSTVELLIDKGANVNAMDKSLNTPLHVARTPSIAKCLLEHGAEVNASNESGDTPLHFVQNFHTAKILIEKGGNVSACNNEGYTPLHTARNIAIAKLLLENGAELKAVTKDGKTVVHTGAEADVISLSQYTGVPEVVEFFLQKGIDVNVADDSGNTPLHCCGTSDNIQVAAVLLEKGANTKALNKSNKTPVECGRFFDSGGGTFCRMFHAIDEIFTAIIDNEGIDRVRRFLREVKTINLTQDDSKLTPLHHAVKQNNKKMVQFLLQEKITQKNTSRTFLGLPFKSKRTSRSCDLYTASILDKINVNPRCKNNWTPLHYAAKGDDPESVTLLLQCGAAYEAKTKEGKTPLDLAECNSIREILTMADEFFEAVKKGKKDLISEILKKNYGIVNAVDSNGCSPLYFAVSNAWKDITSLLLENGANVALVTNSGSTLLHLAAAKGDAELTDTIFKHAKKNGSLNVFVNAEEEKGTTALHVAAQNSLVKMVKALLKHGATYNARNEENKRPLDLSRSEDITNILALIEELFVAAVERSEEVLSRLDTLELDDFFAVTKTCDYYGQTLANIIENNAQPSVTHKLSEMMKLKEREHLLQTNPCHYSQNPCHSEEELEDLDLGFGLFTQFIIMSYFDSPLFAAVESNDISSLSTIMQNKLVNMNELNPCGKTSLHIAVEKGFLELTKKLIDLNSNINALTPDEKTPLLIAAEGGNVALVKLLLEQPNLDVNRLHHGKTPLHIACEKGHTDIVKVLLADNCCSHFINTYFNGKAPIHIASEYGQTEILSDLLEKEPDVNAVDDDGCTSLWISIKNNLEECVQILLKDERVDVKTRHFNQTPLERALKEKNTNISKLIIDRVGDIEISDEDGLNPFHRAVDAGMLDVVDYLIKKGANIHSKTKNGNTPLHIAAKHGHTEVAKLLVENGADIHARSENYYKATPLQYAIKCKKLEVAKFLISEGSDVNAYDPLAHYARNRGGTLLHYAARDTDDKLIRFLVENGADVNATENDGRTPLCLLVKHNGSLDTMRYLIEKGATLNNARGGTPLYWAMRQDYGGYDPKAADFLIKMGTDVNSCIDYHGDEWDQMRTALHLARHLSTVKLLIDKGANVNAMDKLLNTPLHSAWTPSITKCLIQHGAEVNASNASGDTPLHFVQNFHIAKALIEKGGNVNACNNEGITPLHTARNAAVAKLLLENGAELKAVTKDGKSVLHTAAEADIMDSRFKGVPGVAEFFLQNGIDVDTVDNFGNTPLHLCGISENLGVANVLLDNGAKINVRNKSNKRPIEMNRYPDFGNSYLSRKLSAVDQIFTAVIHNEGIEKVKSLLKIAEVVNQKQDDSRLTLLHHAVSEIIKQFYDFFYKKKLAQEALSTFPEWLNRGKGVARIGDLHISRILEKINVNPICKNNWTPLHYAAKGDDPESVSLLLQCGAAYEAKTNEGKTPLDLAECNSTKEILTMVDELFEAVKKGKQELVSELVKKKNGIVNAVDSNGCSPLYFAVSNAWKDITSLLLENGAHVALVTNSGSTLLHLAAAKGDAELTDTIFKLAKKNGSLNRFVNAKGENGTTALHIAAQNESVEITKALLKHGAMYNARNKENKKPSDLSRKEDVTRILNLVEELFKAGEENTEELLSRLREMEFDEFFVVTNAQDYDGQTLLDYIRNNVHPSAGSEFAEIKKSKDRELLLQPNPCYYSQPPVYSQEELDDIDLGFGLFDG